jgi:hypothetical protein
MVVYSCNPSYSVEGGRRSSFEATLGKGKSQTYLKNKKLGVVAQVVECLSRKCEALSSIPSTTKKKQIYND